MLATGPSSIARNPTENLHWVTLTMTMPRLIASASTLVMALSCPWGALPAPNVSSTRPRSPSSRNTASTISGLIPGKMRRQATCVVSRLVWMLKCSMLLGRFTSSQLTLVRMEVVTASGGQLGDANAAKSLADTLLARFPRKRRLLK